MLFKTTSHFRKLDIRYQGSLLPAQRESLQIDWEGKIVSFAQTVQPRIITNSSH